MNAKFCPFWPEKTKFLKIFKKFLRFFWSKSQWKIDFFINFHEIFRRFLPLLESIYLWKITPDFYNVCRFRGRGVPPVPPLPTPRNYLWHNWEDRYNGQKLHNFSFCFYWENIIGKFLFKKFNEANLWSNGMFFHLE